MARIDSFSRIDNDLVILPSRLGHEDESAYHEDFHYAATAQIPAAWTLATGGGAAAVAGIGAIQTPRGALLLTTGTDLNNEATAAFGAVVADLDDGVDWYFRFQMTRITDVRYQFGLRKDANNYALLQFADATSPCFQFITNNAGAGAVTFTSAVAAKAAKWYLAHFHTKPNAAGLCVMSAKLWSSEAATSGWQRCNDGTNLVANDDLLLPYAAAKLTVGASTKSLLIDVIDCFNGRY